MGAAQEEEIKLLTLDEFIAKEGHPYNAFVTEPDFEELYVRKAQRYLGDRRHKVLDIARVKAEFPGDGAFTRLTERLLARGIHLYVECVQNPRFDKKLIELGFLPSQTVPHSYYKLGVNMEKNKETAEKLEAVSTREELKAVIGPIREEHDREHTTAALLDPSCPFCNGDIT